MKKSKVCILTGITAGALLLTGCRETPDSVIVKQKGEKAIEKYEEEKTDTSSGEASRNIREKLSVPETFSEDITAEDGKIIIHTDAAVELPDTTGFSTVEVKAVPLTQEFMDTITNGLFPEKKMYEPEYYYGMTKEYYQNKINEVRALMAQDSAESESGEVHIRRAGNTVKSSKLQGSIFKIKILAFAGVLLLIWCGYRLIKTGLEEQQDYEFLAVSEEQEIPQEFLEELAERRGVTVVSAVLDVPVRLEIEGYRMEVTAEAVDMEIYAITKSRKKELQNRALGMTVCIAGAAAGPVKDTASDSSGNTEPAGHCRDGRNPGRPCQGRGWEDLSFL